MKIFRTARLMLLALLVSLIPASSFAGVFISVGFAPPILPVYDQPPCPEPGLMWTPGYWAYGPDGYYWVDGMWVPAPYEGALWTPPYWGWEGGLYIFHPGYWGRHVGYYGGVNYGFGYMGVGFVGGMWRGRDFVYNTAVMRVDPGRIHNTYVDRNIVVHNTIVNDRRVAFSGGPGGIRHDAAPEERLAQQDQHMGATSFQHSRESSAMSNKSSYYHGNGGRPGNPAVNGQVGAGMHGSGTGQNGAARGNFTPQTRTSNPGGAGNEGRGNYDAPHSNGSHSTQQPSTQPQYHAMPQQKSRPVPQQQSRPVPQQQSRPAPQQQSRPAPQQHEQGQHGGEHNEHQH